MFFMYQILIPSISRLYLACHLPIHSQYPSFPSIFSIHPLPSIWSSMHLPISISNSLNPCLETRSLSISKYLDLHVSFHLYCIHTSIYFSSYIYIHLFFSPMHATMTSSAGSAQKRRPNHTGEATSRYARWCTQRSLKTAPKVEPLT